MLNNNLPIDTVLAITYRCNARCTMCDIWQIKDHSKELNPQEYSKMPSTLKDINISGGEPFLHPNLEEIIKNLKKVCPKANFIFSSNGFAPEIITKKIANILPTLPNLGVSISIDGLEKTHNKVRGIPNGFQKSMQTIEKLKKMGIKNIKLAFTLTNDNLSEMTKVFDLSQKLNIGYTMSAMQNSDIYFGNKKNNLQTNTQELKKSFKYIIRKQLKKNKPKEWARAYYTQGLLDFLLNEHRDLPIEAGQAHFFMDPKGNVYPSVVDSQLMGNLKDYNTFAKLWQNKKNQKLKQELQNGLAKQSWMVCTARTAIKKHPLKVGWWILKNKFKI